ncbi:MAG: hypothetical protein WED85_11405 [Dehalococcoidia bacterium]
MERLVDSADVVVTGAIDTVETVGDVRFAVDRYYKGSGPPVILVVNPDKDVDPSELTDCSAGAYVSGGTQPQFFQSVSGGYMSGYCLSYGALIDNPDVVLQKVIAHTGNNGGAPGAIAPDDGKGVAWYLVGVVLILPLVGVGAWLSIRRRSAGH